MQVPLAPDAGADVALAIVAMAFVPSAAVLQSCQMTRLPDFLPCLHARQIRTSGS